MTSLVVATSCSGKPESIPKTYSGEAYDGSGLLNSKLDDAEYPLRAWIGNDLVGYGSVIDGEYSIKILPCWGESGDIIFIINGIEANQKGTYLGKEDWGENESLDLVFNPKPPKNNTCGDNSIQLGEECDGINLGRRDPNSCGEGWAGTISCSSTCEIDYSSCTYTGYCGDGIENNGETCSSCPADVGACQSSGGSSGGSGGGSSGGGGGGGSSSSTTTIINIADGSGSNGIVNDTIGLSEENNETSTDSEGKKGITGLVVGDFVKTTGGKISIAVLALIILGLIFVSVKKKSGKKLKKIKK